MADEIHVSSEQRLWLFSRRADFWLACGGASTSLLAAALLIFLHGNRELDIMDLVLSEFHLGATYDAIIRRRLWRQRRVDVVLIPLVILALTYALSGSGQTTLLASIAMYAAIWHRGRQSLGVARFYQRALGGPVSRAHEVLFRGAIYLPMLAGLITYSHLAPTEYEGESYFALNFGAEVATSVGMVAVIWVIAYFGWAFWCDGGERQASRFKKEASECLDGLSMNGKSSIVSSLVPFALRFSKGEQRIFRQPGGANKTLGNRIHPGEWWVVLAHAVAFGSGYVLGAANASFLLVLAVHHEVQYLYFAYAMARRSKCLDEGSKSWPSPILFGSGRNASWKAKPVNRNESNYAVSFLIWPVASFVGAFVGGWFQLGWLTTLGTGGLFCHYWLDGRIWTRQSLQN